MIGAEGHFGMQSDSRNPAHKFTYDSERNLTVTALDFSDGSIAVEAKAEA